MKSFLQDDLFDTNFPEMNLGAAERRPINRAKPPQKARFIGRNFVDGGFIRRRKWHISLIFLCVLCASTVLFSPTAVSAQSSWLAVYWNNTNLEGSPVLIRPEFDDNHNPGININWGFDSPDDGTVNKDYFSARWTRNQYLEPGRYRFTTTSDDGVRLWINDELRIDQWHSQTSLSHSTDMELGGTTAVKLEYYDEIGLAEARLTWERLDAPSAAQPISPTTPSSSMSGPENVPTATVINANHPNIRSGPGMEYDPFTHLSRSEAVTMVARNRTPGWIKVQLANGDTGWVGSGFLLSTYPKINLPITAD